MGYSCTRAAGLALDFVLDQSAIGGSSNVFRGEDGETYFFERGRENFDGAITGTVYRNLSDTTCRMVGSVRIEPKGYISRFPHMPRHITKKAREKFLKGDFADPPLISTQ